LNTIHHFTNVPDGKLDFCKNNASLFSEILLILQDQKRRAVDSLEIYRIIACCSHDLSNKDTFLQSEHDLLRKIVHYKFNIPRKYVDEEGGGLLTNFSTWDESFKPKFADYCAIELTNMTQSGTVLQQITAWKVFENFLLDSTMGGILGAQGSELISVAVTALKKCHNIATTANQDLEFIIWTCVWYFIYYTSVERRVQISNPSVKLVSSFVELIKSKGRDDVVVAALNGMFNLAMTEECAENLGCVELDLIPTLINLAQNGAKGAPAHGLSVTKSAIGEHFV
jgi:hypothetical protein